MNSLDDDSCVYVWKDEGGSLWEFFKYPSLVLGAKLGSFSGCNKKNGTAKL